LLPTIDKIEQGKITSQVQDQAQASYAQRINKQEAQINWQASAVEIERMLRAFYPWPVAYTLLGETRLRIFAASVLTTESDQAPGTIVAASKDGLDVATGQGLLRVTQAQLPGKKRMPMVDILNAHADMFLPLHACFS